MISVDYSLIIVILNFILLLIVLKKLLYKPITNFLSERQKQIMDDVENAKVAKEEANELRSKTDEQLKNAHIESRKIVELAEHKATEEAHGIIEQAKEKEVKILAETEAQLALEKVKVMSSLKGDIADMVSELSGQLIDEKMNSAKDKEFIKKALQNRGIK